MSETSTHRASDPARERGFTLPELLVVMLIIGILAAIAIPTWRGTIDSRNVTTASRQINADIRLAHNNAVNQLTSWRIDYTIGSPVYFLREQAPCGLTCTEIRRTLPQNTKVLSTKIDSEPTNSSANSSGYIQLNSDGTGTLQTTNASPRSMVITLSTTSNASQQTIS